MNYFSYLTFTMDAADALLSNKGVAAKQDLGEQDLLLKSKPKPDVTCDIVNECQMFMRAEDGGGDGQHNTSANMHPGTSAAGYFFFIQS